MKKILAFLIVVLFATNAVLADDVSVQQAIHTAYKFVTNQASIAKARDNDAPETIAPKLSYTLKSKVSGKDNVYVINLGDQQGFVIVSGESSTEVEILGYCDHGSFSYEQAPMQLKELLGIYSANVDALRQNPSLAAKATQKTRTDIGSVVVGPLLTTTWDQWGPFNNLCPEGCPTGCYPTAIAQVMKYWRWPKETKGKTQNNIDFSGRTYDWDNMLDYYYSGYNYAQANAVAQLMADIGLVFGTTYAPEGSPTSFSADPLVEYFNFEPDYKTHHGTTGADLVDVMKAELNEKRPVLYSGTGYGRHALVCDGYTNNNYFHFNYGWGGEADGYYYQGLCSFSNDVSIFSNIRPYDAIIKEIDNVKYGLLKDGNAEILEYTQTAKEAVLDIPTTVKDDEGKEYKVNRIRYLSFFRKGQFNRMTIGENVEVIDPYSFFYTDVDTLILSDKMKVVPDEAFQFAKVRSLTIGSSVKRIGKRAFNQCKLFEVKCKSPAFEADDEAFAWSIPDDSEWLSCITKLGRQAFVGAHFNGNPKFTNLEEIGDSAFSGAIFYDDKIFYLSPKLKNIAPSAFNGAGINGMTLDDSNPYYSLDYGKYLYNKNKTSLLLTVFYYDRIEASDYPATMVRMGPGSICARPGFGMEIPNTVIEMEGAFRNCDRLFKLTCLATVPPIITDSTFNDLIFENEPDITLYVPEGTEELYREASGWRRFPNIVGDQPYVPAPEQGREYYMVMHRSGEQQQNINVPISQVSDIHLNNNQTTVVVSQNGKGDITTNVAFVDSITWTSGFVYDNAEVFNLNDSTLTAEAQKCTVTLSPTVIDEDVQMCIRNSVLTPNVIDGLVRGVGVDISLSNDVHVLSGVATITIPIQRYEGEKAQAAYFNKETGEWEPVYFKYDEVKEAVVIMTDHLSDYCAFIVKNDNTKNATLKIEYDDIPLIYDLTGSLGKMYEIVMQEKPEEEAVQAWRDDYGFWQSIGIDGGWSTLQFLGFDYEHINNAIEVVGYLGLASTILDAACADLKRDDIGVASNTLKSILSFATGQMASAVGTSIMSVSMGLTAFISVALEKFGTMVQERKKELFNVAYHIYYSKEGRRLVNNQSSFGSDYYRTTKDWYDYFYPYFEKATSEEKLRSYIEQSVRRYCDRFWEDTGGAYDMCIAEAKAQGLTSYMYPDEAMKQQISDEYFAELINGELVSVFESIKENIEVQACKRYKKSVKDYQGMMNTNVGLRITDSSWKQGEKSQFAGWKVGFTEVPNAVTDPKMWQKTIDDEGKANIGFITEFAIIRNKTKCQLTLMNEADVEQKTYDFQIPAGTGKVIIDIDLATGGTEVETPHLKDLKLAYDPVSIEGELTFAGQYDNGQASDIGMETNIFLDNSFNSKARFQTAIEKFFKRHDFIVVDQSGNIRIGDDMVGKFEGDKGKGKFTIKTSHDFVESTPEDIVELVNNGKCMSLALHSLLNGTIQHEIDCEFTLTRGSVEGEYNITYTGTGTYALNANVVDRIDHINLTDWPNGRQYVTVSDISTGQVQADGSVTLTYSTKLKE